MSYFSRVTLNASRVEPEQLTTLACSDSYKEHQALWRLFASDPNAERDFLFRRDELYHGLRYFVVSQREPLDQDGIWSVESKFYNPQLETGQQLAFSLRVNPVVTRKGEDGKSKRHDVVMDLKRKDSYQKKPKPERDAVMEIAKKAGVAWLERRAIKYGFSFNDESVQVEGYHKHRSHKRGTKISYSTIDFSGLLRVDDPGLFGRALQNGIGPAKAFGCGLMLVRRI